MHLDIAFKAFVGVLAAIVIVGSGLGVTTGFSQAVAADNYMESVSKVIVESNFSQTVIDQCKQDAIENGYVLEVNTATSQKAGVKTYAEVTLTYYFEIKLFHIRQEKVQKKVI